ncbi:MAG: helix-turn-helix domain-containing protein [Acidimicrobiales bacterium]
MSRRRLVTMGFTGHHPRSPKRLYTLEEAAASLGISRTRLHQLVATGAIASLKLGRRRMFRPQDLDDYVEGLASGPTPWDAA